VLRLQGSDLCDLKPDRCVALRQIVVYPHLTKDREPTSSSSPVGALAHIRGKFERSHWPSVRRAESADRAMHRRKWWGGGASDGAGALSS